jgi:hypothetical protein
MADIAEELKTYLKSISAVTDLVGAGTAARIYTHRAKQGVTLPYIVFQVYEGQSYEHLTGITGVAMNRVEVNCYAATSSAAYTLAEAVRLAPLQMFRGMMNSTFVHNVTSDGGYERDFDPPDRGGNQRRYFVSRDYLITYEEPTIA